MMKRLFILFTIFLSYASTTLQAQDNLPQNFSISLGGGVTLPRVEGNRNDFFSKNGDRAGYNLMTEGRYYFMPNFALGLQYDYLRVARLPDKMHLHYIHPNITYRYLWSEGNQGAFLSFGIGYMNYQERTYQRSERNIFSERLLRTVIRHGLRVLHYQEIIRSVSCRYTHSRLVCKPRRTAFQSIRL